MNTRPKVLGRLLGRARRIACLGLAVISCAACSAASPDKPSTSGSAEPAVSTHSAVPVSSATTVLGTGTSYFAGSEPNVPATFDLLPSWEVDDVFVVKSGVDPTFGLAFYDVDNIYSDGCRWQLVDPPPGPDVEDLVSAFKAVPGFAGASRDVSLDGHDGKRIRYTVPNYDDTKCREGKFGIFDEPSNAGEGPSLWAQTPGQENDIWILDVDGTRLVILLGYPQNVATRDRADLESMLRSVRIG